MLQGGSFSSDIHDYYSAECFCIFEFSKFGLFATFLFECDRYSGKDRAGVLVTRATEMFRWSTVSRMHKSTGGNYGLSEERPVSRS